MSILETIIDFFKSEKSLKEEFLASLVQEFEEIESELPEQVQDIIKNVKGS